MKKKKKALLENILLKSDLKSYFNKIEKHSGYNK